MRPFALLITCIILSSTVFAQINVGIRLEGNPKNKPIPPADLDRLRQSTTYFIIRPAEEELLEEYQAVLDDIWTFNPIKVITWDEKIEQELKLGPGRSFIQVEGHLTAVEGRSTSYAFSHYYFQLWSIGEEIPYSKKELKRLEEAGKPAKTRYENKRLADIALYPPGDVILLADEFRDKKSLSPSEKGSHMWYIQHEAKFYNLHLGFIKNALQEVQRYLESGEPRSKYSSDQNDKQLKNLRRAKLYFPDYLLIKYNPLNADESERHDPEELFKNYEHPYEVVTAHELSEMILTAKEPFYYFNYVRSSTDAFYTVTNALTGEIIFSVYDPMTYNIKPGNIKNLSKEIEKAK